MVRRPSNAVKGRGGLRLGHRRDLGGGSIAGGARARLLLWCGGARVAVRARLRVDDVDAVAREQHGRGRAMQRG